MEEQFPVYQKEKQNEAKHPLNIRVFAQAKSTKLTGMVNDASTQITVLLLLRIHLYEVVLFEIKIYRSLY